MRKILVAFGILGCVGMTTVGVSVLADSSPDPVPAPEVVADAEEPLEISFPDPVMMAGCTAHQDCADGSTIQCEGWDVCQVFSTSVKCDNTTVTCPSSGCSVSTVCCDGRRVFCSGTDTCEKEEGRYVLCDGGDSGGGFCPFCPDYDF